MEICKEMITPEKASQYLESNIENNRSVSKRWVDNITELMRRGDWMANGDTIKFQAPNGDGIEHLLDGQHRLMAIIRLDKPVECLVARGLSDQTFLTIDSGRKRTAADCLTIAGYKNAATLAAGLRNLVQFEDDHTFGVKFKTFPNTLIMQCLDKHPDIIDSVTYGGRGKYIVPGSILVFIHYLLSRDNHDMAGEFILKITEGVSMLQGDPILVLRERLMRYKANGVRLRKQLIIALLFKTWNYYYEGRTVTKLIYNPHRESFPVLLGLDRKKLFGSDYPEPNKNSK